MGPNIIGGISSASTTAATNFTDAKETQATASMPNLKINYGDASKAERLSTALTKTQQMQTQAQAFVHSRNPVYAGIG